MIGKILFPVMLIGVVILGGFGADFIRGKSSGGEDAHASEVTKKGKDSHGKSVKSDHGKKDDGHGKKTKKKKKKKGGHGADDGDEDGASSAAISYLKFKRQFVVPVVKGGKIESLVLLNLNLEIDADSPENIHIFEPKLRDALMRELMALSHNGLFTGDLTNTETYDHIRDSLLSATKHVLESGVKNVLILDLSRQEQ